MFRTVFVCVVSMLILGPVRSAEPKKSTQSAVAFFDSSKVWQVHVEMSAEEFAAMQPRGGPLGFGPPKAKEPAKEAAKDAGPPREVHRNTFGVELPWAKGTVTIDGVTFRDIGVRFKGNGTISDATRQSKKSFKLDLDHFGGKERFQGVKSFNLHCGVADPSKGRETLGYDIYRSAGVPAPRTTFAEVRVTVPGKFDKELYGLYTIVEQIDKPFLRHHFGDDQGLLMKPEGLREFADLGDEWEKYKKPYAAKRDPSPAEVKRIVELVRLIVKADDATFRQQIGSIIDVEGFLRYLATTAYIANPDSFFSLGHNFYVYLHSKSNKFHFFPWDLDRAFSNLPVLGSNTQQMNLSLVHPYAGTHRLTERLLAMPEVSQRYQQLLKELAGTAFAKDRLLKRIAQISATTKEPIAREQVAAANRKEVGPGYGPAAFLGKPPALDKFVERRTVSVEAQLAGTSKGHVPVGSLGGAGFKVGDFVAGPMIEELDDNNDGKLSRSEWVAAAKRVYRDSDKTGTGSVNEKNVADALNQIFVPQPADGAAKAPANPFGPGNFMSGPIFKRVGPDKDGRINLQGMITAAEKIFDEFDKSKSGLLDETTFGELLNALFPMPKMPAPPKK